MNGPTLLVLALLAAAVLLALRARKKGCGGNCAGCPHDCGKRKE